MKTPYIPHLFGAAVEKKLTSRHGWLTAGVASSVPWPREDVWVQYDGHEYILRGIGDPEQIRPSCITTPCDKGDVDNATTRVYRFASVLGWFKGGYVDPNGAVWSTSPILYGSRERYTSILDASRYFSCNYMPIIESDQVRKALAFMREGRRLRHVHEPYSFLSFFKVVESQFKGSERVAWIEANLDLLEGEAAGRVEELRANHVNVSTHLFQSGRCAVAHASLGGNIVDPDVPADRVRIAQDLDVMEALAERYIKVEIGVPDAMTLFETYDWTSPWHGLLPEETLKRLQNGESVTEPSEFGRLAKTQVSVRLWPYEPASPLSNLTMVVECTYGPGIVGLLAYNERSTVFLRFALDLVEGQLHTMLEHGGLTEQYNEVTELELEHYTRYFHSVVGNALTELCMEGVDPVPCEIVIPMNIRPRAPEEAVAEAIETFRRNRAYRLAQNAVERSSTEE